MMALCCLAQEHKGVFFKLPLPGHWDPSSLLHLTPVASSEPTPPIHADTIVSKIASD